MAPSQSSPAIASLEYYPVRYAVQKVGNLDIFFREAGDPRNPADCIAAWFSNFISHVSGSIARLS